MRFTHIQAESQMSRLTHSHVFAVNMKLQQLDSKREGAESSEHLTLREKENMQI